MKNKIGWCSMTFNPVWGCLNHCPYCYARKIAKRFANKVAENEYYCHFWGNEKSYKDYYLGEGKSTIDIIKNKIYNFQPTFLYSQFNKIFPKKPQRIFVGSMSEIYYWEKEWVRDTLDKVLEYPQHTFMFLTKYPEIYDNWYWHNNCWLGITVTQGTDLYKPGWNDFQENNNNKHFISFEPLLEDINLHLINWSVIDWVIIGAETGDRKGRVIPKREWIENIVDYCRDKNIPVYLKDSLKGIYPIERREFPK